MKKKCAMGMALVLAISMLACGVLAESVVGSWSGSASISGFPFPLSASVTFAEDGTYSIRCFGLSAAGNYVEKEDALSVTVSSLSGLLALQLMSPEEIGRVGLPISLDGDKLVISANKLGLEGTLSLTRD